MDVRDHCPGVVAHRRDGMIILTLDDDMPKPDVLVNVIAMIYAGKCRRE
jgi:hypothetical protein